MKPLFEGSHAEVSVRLFILVAIAAVIFVPGFVALAMLISGAE
jgi:hypothetical protein